MPNETPAAKSSETAPAPPASPRLMSLDALRGFDMFWIIGADALVYALQRIADGLQGKVAEGEGSPLYRFVKFITRQLQHADWEGFRFYDLIFPLFIFIAGASLVFSLTKTIEREGRAKALRRVIQRGLLLVVIGIFYSGGLTSEWPDIRLMGVLNRIGLAYLFAGVLFCFLKPRGLVIACVTLLAGYWALMTFLPFPDVRPTPDTAYIGKENGFTSLQKINLTSTNRISGTYIKGVNLANYVDQKYLPGRKYDGTWDPEGILSTLPAVATCLLGVFAGLLLKNPAVPDQRKVAWLVGVGLAAVVLGWLWNLQFPVIKKIWTSSYVLVAGGYSAILLAGFYYLVDVRKRQSWCQPFVWMGMNSITIYLASNFIGGFRKISARLVGGDVKSFFDSNVAAGFGDLVISIVGLLLAFWFVRFLYQRKIFLRL